MTIVTLPWPPAVNNLFFNAGKRRVRSSRYTAWIAEALTRLREQSPTPIKGSFHVRIICDRPNRIRRDLDGLLKAPLDLLVAAGVIEDDSLAQSIAIQWSDAAPAKPGSVRVCVEGI